MKRILFLRSAPLERARGALSLLERTRDAEITVALQEGVTVEGWGRIVRIPDGMIEADDLSRLALDYDEVFVPLSGFSPRGYGNILEGLKGRPVTLIFPDGSMVPVTGEIMNWAGMTGDEEEEYQLRLVEELADHGPDEDGPPRVIMLANYPMRNDSRIYRHAAAVAGTGRKVVIVGPPNGGGGETAIPEGVEWAPASGGRPGDLALAERALDYPVSAVHCHDINSLHIGARVSEAREVPLVLCLYDCWWCEKRPDETSDVMERKFGFIEERWMRRVDAILTPTLMTAHACRYRYGREALVVRNAAILPEPPPAPGNPPADPVLVFTGNLHPTRNLDILFEGIKLIPSLRARILSPSDPAPYRALAREMGIGERVSFEEAVHPARVPVAIAGAWAGVVLPFTDGPLNDRMMVPIKFYEYIAAGIPVLAGDVPELAGLVRKHDLGVVVRERSGEAFAEAAERLLMEPGLWDRCRRNVMRYRLEVNWEKESRKIERLYDDLRVPR